MDVRSQKQDEGRVYELRRARREPTKVSCTSTTATLSSLITHALMLTCSCVSQVPPYAREVGSAGTHCGARAGLSIGQCSASLEELEVGRGPGYADPSSNVEA